MKLFFVYQEEYCKYTEYRGSLVFAETWQQAKGIAMTSWTSTDKNNIKVEEVEMKQGIICDVDYIK